MRPLITSFALLLALTSLGAAPDRAACETVLKQADTGFAGEAKSPARREALAAVHRTTLQLGSPEAAQGAATAWWFAELRRRAGAAKDPEIVYFLQTELRLDPAGSSFAMLSSEPVAKVPYQPGQGVAAELADVARSLDLGEKPRMTSAQLRALATNTKPEKDPSKVTPEQAKALAEQSKRALVLLRRLDPAAAAPLLWARLAETKQRSEILFWEEQLMRLPVQLVGGVPYDAQAAPAAKAVWLRLAAVRPQMPASSLNRAGWVELLKGPANEVTEAAWDAAPRVFRAADRAELAALSKDAPERIAVRAKVALERLR